MTNKNFFDYVSDWFKILLKSGVPALLIGLGWLSIILSSVWLGSSWNSGPVFWVVGGSGVMMILLGYRAYRKDVESLSAEK